MRSVLTDASSGATLEDRSPLSKDMPTIAVQGVKTAGLRLRLVDAKEQVVGRLASQLSAILQVYEQLCILHDSTLLVQQPGMPSCLQCSQGKDKPTYQPERDEGDIVVVKNARHVEFTGKKWDQKLYRWHTGSAPHPMQC